MHYDEEALSLNDRYPLMSVTRVDLHYREYTLKRRRRIPERFISLKEGFVSGRQAEWIRSVYRKCGLIVVLGRSLKYVVK